MKKSLQHLIGRFSVITRFAVLLLLGFGSVLLYFSPAPCPLAGAVVGVLVVYFPLYMLLGLVELWLMHQEVKRDELDVRRRLRSLHGQ